MKFKILAAVICSTLAAGAFAADNTDKQKKGVYIGISGGVASGTGSGDHGSKGVGCIEGGYQYGNGIRIGIEYSKYGTTHAVSAFEKVTYGEEETILKKIAEQNEAHARNALNSAIEDHDRAANIATDKLNRLSEANAELSNTTANYQAAQTELDNWVKDNDPNDPANAEKYAELLNKVNEADKAQQAATEDIDRAGRDWADAVKSEVDAQKVVDNAQRDEKEQAALLEEANKAWEASKKAVIANLHWKVKSDTVQATAYYDIDTGTALTPYVMGGLGVSFNDLSFYSPDVSGLNGSKSKTSFAWQLGTGLSYAV